MKRLLFLSFIGLFAQFLVSCYPGGADNVEEMDVAITNYDKKCGLHQVHHILAPRHYCLFRGKKEKLQPRIRCLNFTTGKRQFYPTRILVHRTD